MLLLVFAGKALGQDCWDVSLYGGTNVSNMKTQFDEYDNAWGGQGGFLVKRGWTWAQIEGGLEYSYKGYKYDQRMTIGMVTGPDVGKYNDKKCRISSMSHHITLPISLAIGVWPDYDEGGFGFTISGGGYVDIGIAGKTKLTEKVSYIHNGYQYAVGEEEKYETDVFGNLNHQLKRFDAGWQVGAMIALGPVVRLGATYRLGLVNVSNISNYKMYNKSIMVNLLFNCNYDD